METKTPKFDLSGIFIRAFIYADYTLSLVSHSQRKYCNEDLEGSCIVKDGKLIQECSIKKYLLEIRDIIHNSEMPTYNNIGLYIPWMQVKYFKIGIFEW